MKMKFWLYIVFFAVFTFVFSQIAFPFSAVVKSINMEYPGSAESLPVFNAIQSNAANTGNLTFEYFIKDKEIKEIYDHLFLEYEVVFESTGLIPIDILKSKVNVDERYKDRVIARAEGPFEKKISAVRPSSKKFTVLIDSSGMSQNEIHEMVNNIFIYVTWKSMPGWERESKVHLPEDTITTAK